MNNTDIINVEYSIGEKVALPFVFIPCMILSYILYRYGKRSLRDSETFSKRMQYLYYAIGSGIVGQYIFHTMPKGASTAYSEYDSVFIFLGFFVMVCIQKFTRVNNENEYYNSPSLPSMEIKHILNSVEMQTDDYIEADGLDQPIEDGKTTFGQNMLTVMDENKEISKRKLLAVFFYIPMSFITIVEGFFLMYRVKNSITTTIIAFYMNKIIQTFIVCGVLLHGMFHVQRSGFKHWYFLLSVGFCLLNLLSSIPVLAELSTAPFLEHVVVSKIYLFLSGLMLYIGLYFVWLERQQTNKRETIIGLVVMLFVGACCYATGIFI